MSAGDGCGGNYDTECDHCVQGDRDACHNLHAEKDEDQKNSSQVGLQRVSYHGVCGTPDVLYAPHNCDLGEP